MSSYYGDSYYNIITVSVESPTVLPFNKKTGEVPLPDTAKLPINPCLYGSKKIGHPA